MDVLRIDALAADVLESLLAPYGLVIEQARGEIPGSYWGESEAGLIGNRLILRGAALQQETTRVPAALRALLNRRVASWNGCEF